MIMVIANNILHNNIFLHFYHYDHSKQKLQDNCHFYFATIMIIIIIKYKELYLYTAIIKRSYNSHL